MNRLGTSSTPLVSVSILGLPTRRQVNRKTAPKVVNRTLAWLHSLLPGTALNIPLTTFIAWALWQRIGPPTKCFPPLTKLKLIF